MSLRLCLGKDDYSSSTKARDAQFRYSLTVRYGLWIQPVDATQEKADIRVVAMTNAIISMASIPSKNFRKPS